MTSTHRVKLEAGLNKVVFCNFMQPSCCDMLSCFLADDNGQERVTPVCLTVLKKQRTWPSRPSWEQVVAWVQELNEDLVGHDISASTACKQNFRWQIRFSAPECEASLCSCLIIASSMCDAAGMSRFMSAA